MTVSGHLTRRTVLAAGGLLVAVGLPDLGVASVPDPSDAPRENLGAFLHIGRDNVVTFISPTVEMGQGTYTIEPQIIAEELGCTFDQIRVVAAPANDALYANPAMHMQLTAGSTSTLAFYDPLRRAGASARMRLVAAAAARWHVPAAQCEVANGVVLHRASGRSATFGSLASAAARITPPDPQTIALKPNAAFRLIGKSVPRLDVQAKSTGAAVYGIDIVRPGMKFAVGRTAPQVGGRLAHVDPAPALAVSGVRQVIPMPDAVAVVADHSWAAIKGLASLEPVWTGGDPTLSTPRLEAELVSASSTTKPVYTTSTGNTQPAIAGAHEQIAFDYTLPFLAHLPMEPLNTVVDLTPDGCDVWIGTQAPPRATAAVVALTGLPAEKVRIHNQLVGGGFGRRATHDHLRMAITIAKTVGVPIKLLWLRDQELRAGMYRPLFHQHVEVGIDAAGRPVGWSHRIAGGSVFASFLPELAAQGIPDSNAIEGAAELLYAVGPTRLDYVRHDPPVPITWWRSVGPGHNIFVVEGVISELAERAGQDPVSYRRELIGDREPRARRLLDLAAEKAGWGTPLPARTGRGVAVQKAFGGYLAAVIEASVDKDGGIQVRRVVLAADCGLPINPNNVAAQLEGGVIFGLSAALWGEITIAGGRVMQDNFNAYRVLRFSETPPIEVHLVQGADKPGGIGEAGTSIVFPALAGAIFAATGKRLRSLPFDRHAELAAHSWFDWF